jgi:hypothetical protein
MSLSGERHEIGPAAAEKRCRAQFSTGAGCLPCDVSAPMFDVRAGTSHTLRHTRHFPRKRPLGMGDFDLFVRELRFIRRDGWGI